MRHHAHNVVERLVSGLSLIFKKALCEVKVSMG